MEALKGVKQKVTGKASEAIFDMFEKMIGDIDAFDQIGELLKTIVPLKAEVTVKGKKAVEVQAMLKNSVLWVGFKRIKEEPKSESPTEEIASE